MQCRNIIIQISFQPLKNLLKTLHDVNDSYVTEEGNRNESQSTFISTTNIEKSQWSGTDTIDFHILLQTPNGKGTQIIKKAQSKTTYYKAESQEGISFPVDGHQVILNKQTEVIDKKNKDEQWQLEAKHKIHAFYSIKYKFIY